jgi:hypothetical protein
MVAFRVKLKVPKIAHGVARGHPRLARIGRRVNRNLNGARLEIVGIQLRVVG